MRNNREIDVIVLHGTNINYQTATIITKRCDRETGECEKCALTRNQ